MKIVVLEGSPNKNGSSNLLAGAFIRGAQEAGHTVEVIDAAHSKIHPCTGCIHCGYEGPCVQKDDMAELLEKAERADVLVLASPTYFLTMSGQMKTMIDRLLPKWQGLGGKDAWVIVTGHDGKRGLERNAGDLSAVLEALGDRVRGVIWGERVWQKGEVIGTKAMEDAYLAGKSLQSQEFHSDKGG